MKNTLEKLRFNITEDMNNSFIEVLLTKEMLLNKNQDEKEKQLLENHFKELRDDFITEFRKNNQEQMKIYNDQMKE